MEEGPKSPKIIPGQTGPVLLPDQPVPDPLFSSPPESKEGKSGISWENLKTKGFFLALAETWAEVMFSPRRVFQNLRDPVPGWIAPLTYAVIVGTIGTILSLPGLYLYGTSWLASLGLENEEISGSLIIGILFFAPVFSFFRTLFYSVVFHIFVRFFGGKRDFKNTLSAVSYAESPDVLSVIPILGDLIKGIYKPILLIWGIRESQGISTARAALVVTLPGLLVVFLVMIFAVMFFSMASNFFLSG
ncbi:MAG: YIP1 family protein [Proteobacteria bacterium]|nr:YIP1 family protein [Pseudomonadota bacterium]